MSRPAVVYRFFDETGVLLYVGITVYLPGRLKGHAKDKPWWTQAATATFAHYPDIEAARAEELRAIRDERPRYNIADTPQPPRQLLLLKPHIAAMRRVPTERERRRFQKENYAAFAAAAARAGWEYWRTEGECEACRGDFQSAKDFERHLPDCLGCTKAAAKPPEERSA